MEQNTTQEHYRQAYLATHDHEGRFVGEQIVVAIIAHLISQIDNNENN